MKFLDRLIDSAYNNDSGQLNQLLLDLGHDPHCCATYIESIGINGADYGVFFYYTDRQALFVLFDDEYHRGEKLCEAPPRWTSKDGPRVSPVMALKAMMDAFKESLTADNKDQLADMRGVVYTASDAYFPARHRDLYAQLGIYIVDNLRIAKADLPVDEGYNGDGIDLLINYMDAYSEDKLDDFFAHYEDDYQRMIALIDPKAPAPPLSKEPEPTTEPEPEAKEEEDDDDDDDGFNEFLSRHLLDDIVKSSDSKPQADDKLDFELPSLGMEQMPPVTILPPIVNPQKALKELVGLDDMKKQLDELLSFARYSRRVEREFPQYESAKINLHTIITGNPGTGKSTICRIYGALLRQAGVLSQGHTVVATRSSFIGQRFGDDEERVRQCLKLAQGGCLFIDEAGQLVNHNHPHDPGKDIVPLMLQLLAEEDNRDIAVVLAFYANDNTVQTLYQLNPGIRSRFVNTLAFPDYTWPQMLAIAKQKAKKQGLKFTPTAWKKFCQHLRAIFDLRDKDYSNAREVVNLLQKCIVRHAVRCEQGKLTGSKLLQLTSADIPDHQPTAEKPRVGFR